MAHAAPEPAGTRRVRVLPVARTRHLLIRCRHDCREIVEQQQKGGEVAACLR